jgi:type I restriction enzyme R subunit
MENPLRTDFQKHYEEIIAEYNSEKDRVTIEKTFEALMKYYASMDEEEKRAVREGLEDQDTLALYDLLRKPDLSKKDIEKLKKVAKELLQLIQAEKQKIDNWKEKQVTRDQIKVLIKDFLWDGEKGLPDSYTHEDIEFKTEEVFAHVYNSVAQHK